MKIRLGSKLITKYSKPYFIAEIGVNHENNMCRAKKIIKLAKDGGADAVKFQTYKAEKLARKKSPYYWDLKKVKEKTQYNLFKKFDKFNEKDYIELKKYCDKLKIDFLSTPFDLDAVKFLNKLVPFFKVASADLNNFPLIESICKTKKPIVVSTGASNLDEIKNTYKFISQRYAKSKIVLLHCVLSYPTKKVDAHLEIIKNLQKIFNKSFIGYSDHTYPDPTMQILTTAYHYGAKIIEKHFSDKKGAMNNDHFHSLDKSDLIVFKNNVDIIDKITSNISKRPVLKCEFKPRKNARRSIVTLGQIKKDQKLTRKNLIMKRPGTGLSPQMMQKILGKKAKKFLPDDHLVTFKDIK